jgi:hypothetical protein
LSSAGKHCAPGPDGTVWKFYAKYLEIIHPELCDVLNQMFLQGRVTPRQTLGEMVCVPKQAEASQMEDVQPITLLNTDYNLLARIMTGRLRPRVAEQLQITQYCGFPGNMTVDAVSTIRDIIAFAESTETTVCMLSLDFARLSIESLTNTSFDTCMRMGLDRGS